MSSVLVLCVLGLLGHLDISTAGGKCSKTEDHAANISVCLEMLRAHQYDREFTPLLSSTLREVGLWQRSLVAQPAIPEQQQLYLVTRALDNVLQAARMYAAFPEESSNRLLVISSLIDLLQLIHMLNESAPSTNPAIYLAGFC
jgi:hypothetical protein